MATVFSAILRNAVDRTPNAIGGSFAAWDGELVDSFSHKDPYDWAVLTAHYGVVMQNLYAAFGTLHFGGPEFYIARHAKVDVVVSAVDKSYFALLAVDRKDGDADGLADVLAIIDDAVVALRKEIG